MENSIVVDIEMHHWLCKIMCAKTSEVYKKYRPNSFHHLFWKQKIDAVTRQDARGMHWHPAILQWCRHLRHRSSGAYEELCGVLKLPSQLTLRDYVHYIKAATGFSMEVNHMPVRPAKVAPCPEREKNTTLLIDEMHTREDLVYDKHTGELVTFCQLRGHQQTHLLAFEHSLSKSISHDRPLAQTVMAHGSKFPYFPRAVQFTAEGISCNAQKPWFN